MSGTLTGYTVSPVVNGTFKGIRNSSRYGSAIVTFSITQNPDFTFKVSGTIVEDGVTSRIVPTDAPSNTSVVGATVSMAANSNNINGSNPLRFTGHLNPEATQLTITDMTVGPNENFTGAFTKQ